MGKSKRQNKDKELEKKSKKNKIILKVLLILAFAIWIFYPFTTKENITCNSNYECITNRTYVFFINKKTTYYVDENSTLDLNKYTLKGRRHISYYSNPIINTKLEDFKVFSKALEDIFVPYYICDEKYINFNNYLKNKSQFYWELPSSTILFRNIVDIFYIFAVAILVICLI